MQNIVILNKYVFNKNHNCRYYKTFSEKLSYKWFANAMLW